jgi:hypothetical protein
MSGPATKRLHLALLLLSIAAVAASLLWQGRSGFYIGDEGYLWYGVQRVMRGEVPIRDFLAYDPGRYYAAASLMAPWGSDGLMALRAAVACFEAAGLALALALLAWHAPTRNAAWWLVVAATLVAWMFPRHKLFDIAASVALLGTIASLLAHPTRRAHLLAGVAVGAVAIFGRNHGLYGAIASVASVAWLASRREAAALPFRSGLAWWAAGVLLGYLPLLLMLALVPGFASAFVRSVRIILEAGSTNLPLPIPWPWRAHFGVVPAGEALREVLAGVFFIALPAWGVAGIGWAIVRRRRGLATPPLLLASAILSLIYTHFAYSRADVSHLAQSIFPLLVGAFACVALLRGPSRCLAPGALCAASLYLMLPQHPGWACRVRHACVAAQVGNDTVQVDRGTAADLRLVAALASRYAADGRTFYVAPFWPGAYAAFGRKSPVWEIYPLFPRDTGLQRAEVERLRAARPGFAVILDAALDGREELRFARSHPIIDRYIRESMVPVQGYSTDPLYRIYRDAGSAP